MVKSTEITNFILRGFLVIEVVNESAANIIISIVARPSDGNPINFSACSCVNHIEIKITMEESHKDLTNINMIIDIFSKESLIPIPTD